MNLKPTLLAPFLALAAAPASISADEAPRQAARSESASTADWTLPDARFRHGNPSPGWPEVRPEARPGSY